MWSSFDEILSELQMGDGQRIRLQTADYRIILHHISPRAVYQKVMRFPMPMPIPKPAEGGDGSTDLLYLTTSASPMRRDLQ